MGSSAYPPFMTAPSLPSNPMLPSNPIPLSNIPKFELNSPLPKYEAKFDGGPVPKFELGPKYEANIPKFEPKFEPNLSAGQAGFGPDGAQTTATMV